MLLAYYSPEGTVIPVYLEGNYAADLSSLEYVLEHYGEYEVTRFKKNRLSI